jgi:anti-sigma regulatory factor (Ser/Thr protein kinase)
LARSYPAIPDSVPLARRELAAFAAQLGASEEQIDAVRLAASEAITNVVMHAYHDGGGQIHVRADLAVDELWVLIGDDGVGLRADSDSPGLGVGLALIAQSADGLTIMNRAAGGTEVRMRFDLDEEALIDQARGSRVSATSPASPRFSTTA